MTPYEYSSHHYSAAHHQPGPSYMRHYGGYDHGAPAHGVPLHDGHYSTYHSTHAALDHRYDDQHDVEPVHFHERAVHRAFDSPDARSYAHHSYGRYYNDAAEDSVATAHHVASEETAYEYSHDDRTMNPHYQEPISHVETEHLPAWTETHDTHHHEAPRGYDGRHHESTYHVSHPELDHKFDDQRDVEPVHFHERAVLPAFDSPDARSYEHGYYAQEQHYLQ
mmetsp:Transcript_10303/g.12829  ORF Transcript_10303/g.12829 Transcript_10303/m.12829 type:complete len:222 (-) Transcript_10303:153-818(-)